MDCKYCNTYYFFHSTFSLQGGPDGVGLVSCEGHIIFNVSSKSLLFCTGATDFKGYP